MPKLNSVTVFCGSSIGTNLQFSEQARQLGNLLAAQSIQLVYGGASIGVMGAVADGCLESGGKVIGIIPDFLASKEIAHPNLTTLYVVQTMHERKLQMHNMADAFIMLPGGIGTLEEFFEILTWSQLHIHSKPIGILNTANYYSKLLSFLDEMLESGFIKPAHQKLYCVHENPAELLRLLAEYERPETGPLTSTDKI